MQRIEEKGKITLSDLVTLILSEASLLCGEIDIRSPVDDYQPHITITFYEPFILNYVILVRYIKSLPQHKDLWVVIRYIYDCGRKEKRSRFHDSWFEEFELKWG
jgi:hypothetical protein